MKGERQSNIDLIASTISDVSEYCYCASWLFGAGVAVWEHMHKPGDSAWGEGVVTENTKRELWRAADMCGMWVYWPPVAAAGFDYDDARFPDPVPVPLDAWFALCEKHGLPTGKPNWMEDA